ncbi:MAG: DUF3108 domain-containing protein [Ramlibacter sp.]
MQRTRVRLLVLLGVVLALHAVTLHWLGRYLERPVLRPLTTPMFTRLLQQAAPPPKPPAAAPAVASPKPTRPAITSIAKAPDPARTPAPKPAAAASAPSPAETPLPVPPAPAVAPAPPVETQVAASPPQPAASAPSQAASQAVASTPQQEPTLSPVFAAGPFPVVDWPADSRVNYRLGGQFRSGELNGSARVQWQRQGTRYETRVEIDVTLLASLVLTSQGDVTPQGLFPRSYEELRRSGPRGAKLGDTNITLADGRSVPRPDGVQDTASQFVELGRRFATGREILEVGRSVNVWMARPGAVDLWTYDIVSREMLQTPRLGAVDTFHLKPRPIANPRGNITAEMWFAPSLQYLPVRIRVSMGEDTYVDLMVETIEQR